jgi:small-conductance mechanosensitive channel
VSEKVSWEIIKKACMPFLILVLFLAVYIFCKVKIFPYLAESSQQELKKYSGTGFFISIGFLVQRIGGGILGWYKEKVAGKTVSTLDDELIPFLRRALKVCVWIIILLIILPFYGVNISALVAALGVSSLAIALAAQDTISNIIAGFMIMVDRPFRIDDNIKLPSGEIVTVLDIGVRRSKFLSQEQAIIIVPNLELSKSKIVNYTYGKEFKK